MWRLARSDAITVWSNPLAVQRLQRYKSIIDLKLPAKYLIARNIPADFNPKAPLTNLWKTHQKARSDHQDQLQAPSKALLDPSHVLPSQSFLELKAVLAHRILQECHFCARRCNVDRTRSLGFCEVSSSSYVSSGFLHTGEEAPLVPSGTIFFSGCNLRCAHCQNYDISCNPSNGEQVSPKQLAAIADELASRGAKNINYVGGDPSPHLHTILSSMNLQQFNITQLWNSNMYLSTEAMELLIDVIDFWLPDLKYLSDECAKRISSVDNYSSTVTQNIKMAYDQSTTEMIIRVLVLPNHLECCVIPILDWIANNTPLAFVNIMQQYRPLWRVLQNPETYKDISRRVTSEEIQQAYTHAKNLGLEFRSVS